jgi:hypothetical protein
VQQDGSAAAAMLGLPGFVLLAVSEVDGEIEQAIETVQGRGRCPRCGVLTRLHDRRPIRVRDLPSGRPANSAHPATARYFSTSAPAH